METRSGNQPHKRQLLTMTSKKNIVTTAQANMFSEIPDFCSINHRVENNPESQKHLEENDQKFVGQCAIVLSLLNKGIVLSSYSAMTQHRIGHLPRRIKDLKDNGGVPIEDQFEYDSSGKVTRNKIWFLRDAISEATAVKYKIEWKKKPKTK